MTQMLFNSCTITNYPYLIYLNPTITNQAQNITSIFFINKNRIKLNFYNNYMNMIRKMFLIKQVNFTLKAKLAANKF